MRCTGPCAGKGMTTILEAKKIMWHSIMKEFNCKVSSSWSHDDRTKDTAFTHRKHGDGGQEKVSQVDCVIGPKDRHDDCFKTMKEICGTRGIITGFTQGFRKEEMRNNSWEKEKRTGVDGHPRRWNIKSNLRRRSWRMMGTVLTKI